MNKNLLLLLLLPALAFSQRYDIISGSFKSLSGIKEYSIAFDYSEVKIHGFDSEEDYLSDKMGKREKSGRAQAFEKQWFDGRKENYEPAFIEYFNKRMSGNASVTTDTSQKYTMLVKTTWLYPGYAAEPAKISAVITVYETAQPQNIKLSVLFEKVIGIEKDMFNGDLVLRIASAYEKLAANFLIQLKRVL